MKAKDTPMHPFGFLNDALTAKAFRSGSSGVMSIIHNHVCGICGAGLEAANGGKRIVCANPEGSCDDPHSPKDRKDPIGV